MESFNPVSAFGGGCLIGLSAVLLLAWNGRIAGISGLLGGLLTSTRADLAWRGAFLVGLVLGALLVSRGPLEISMVTSVPGLVVGGLLVGIGTRLGNGCTSGHGVCGVARGSKRSVVALATFLGTGAASVFFVRHVLGWGV